MTAQSAISGEMPKPIVKKPIVSRNLRAGFNTSAITLITLGILGIFLSPFLYMLFTSLKSPDQMTQQGSPIYPARPATFEYNGETLDVYKVPLPDGSMKDLAMLKP